MADPVQQTQYQTNIPQELMPYAQDLLGKAEALTSQTPYQPYQGAQVAQFSPLQQQSYDYASQMKAAPQLQDATAMAGLAGLGGLNTQYTYKPSDFASTFAKDAQGNVTSPFMSPYMQGVVDVQQREAKRQADIAQQQRQAQAVNAGAFGGARQGIMNAQANAELQRNLQGIQATGLQNAYQQAMQQYNTQYGQNAQQQQFGAGLGMQGLGLANQAAANLGALGQTQYGQNVGLIGLQNQLGLQQQQQAQNVLNTQYQNYQNQLNYPYKNLGFMSDIIRGVPLAQSSATMYQAAPTAMQNLTSLGLGAYGLSSLFGSKAPGSAEGGQVKSYAYGGSVMDPEFKRYAVDHIDPRQLPIAQRNAQARGDLDTTQFALEEMAEDAALRRGLTPALPAGVDVVRAAGGGILAFDGGGATKAPRTMQGALESMYGNVLPERDRGEKYVEDVKGIRGGLEGLYPTSEAIPIYEQAIKQQQERMPEIDRQMRGLTALRMAAALQKSGVTSGDRYAGAFEAAASGAEKGQALRDAANSEMMKSKLLMAQAKDSRAMGLTDKAIAEKNAAENYAIKGVELRNASDKVAVQTLGHLESQRMALAAANRPGESERKIADYEKRLGRKLTADEYLDVMGQVGAATYGVRHTGQKGEFEHKAKVDELIQKDKRFESISLDLMRAGGRKDAKSTALRDDANARLAELRKEYEDRYKMTSPVAGSRAPTGGAQTPPPQAVEALRQDPALKSQFDAKYGRGASAKYLGE